MAWLISVCALWMFIISSGIRGIFLKRVFCSSLCLAEYGKMNVLHVQNPGIRVNKILRIPVFTFWPTWALLLSYKLWHFQFLVYIWGPFFRFNTMKTCGFIFCLFCFKSRPVSAFLQKEPLLLLVYDQSVKVPMFSSPNFFLSFYLPKAALCNVIHSSASLRFEENILGWILNYLCSWEQNRLTQIPVVKTLKRTVKTVWADWYHLVKWVRV